MNAPADIQPPADAEELVRLRTMLEHALSMAVDTTDWGRHSALIALDGVCELAMWLSAAHLGLRSSPKSNFHSLLSSVSDELGESWRQSGRRGVMQMRDARNLAQHGGVLPDPALMPGWAAQTKDFVNDLAESAYGRPLDHALYANALSDPELRDLIADAEADLSAGRYAAAIETAVHALYAGRSRWMAQREHAEGVFSLPHLYVPEPGAMSLAENIDDVSMFARDLSEYFWLKSVRYQVAHGALPNREDADRALAFSYHWLLRWQAFDTRYPADRWRASFAAQQPPETPSGVPEIVDVQVEAEQSLGPNEVRRLNVTIANLPNRGRSDWDIPIGTAARTVTEHRGLNPWQLIVGERAPALGQFTVFADPALSGAAVSALLTDLVDETDRLYQARQRPPDEVERILTTARSGVDDALAAQRALFGLSTVELKLNGDGETVWVQVPVHAPAAYLRQIAGIFSDAGDFLATSVATEGGLAFRTPLAGIDDRAGSLSEAACTASEYVARQEQHAEAQHSKTRKLVEELTTASNWTVSDATVDDPQSGSLR